MPIPNLCQFPPIPLPTYTPFHLYPFPLVPLPTYTPFHLCPSSSIPLARLFACRSTRTIARSSVCISLQPQTLENAAARDRAMSPLNFVYIARNIASIVPQRFHCSRYAMTRCVFHNERLARAAIHCYSSAP